MTPGARIQAAIELLGRILAGAPVERELTAWARNSRYAGSKDRAAVRDHVFDALRRLRSSGWCAGQGAIDPMAMDPRAILAGLLANRGEDPATLFTGQGHAPRPFALPPPPGPPPTGVRLDMPDWLLARFDAALGANRDSVLALLRDRAPIFVRTNIRRISPAELTRILAAEGIVATPGPLSDSALEIAPGTRGLAATQAFRDGLFEMQDAGSQALVDRLPAMPGSKVLDLCAGGGGKALAYAARGDARIFAHDADPARMRDIPVRADRAGHTIALTEDPEACGPFDGVIADVPCSGSGSWRRAPEAKWRLTPARLSEFCRIQPEILKRARTLVRPGGWVAYMTCSLLKEENADIVDAELAAGSGLRLRDRWSCTPLDGADGFHLSLLERA
ncbi:RsmB/NOP family class I SAM-dependent RNA methyltransferase [Jannaschia sp. S6380]|uniref:RsmB/NOP family class I SAM-dependent RNA methyltransferase n=1 Tax=Jannaschia sp. S6380 TaxID=2926408 RepID=UPI001FF32D36|nr:RsmB/NOP family class I SAM-dependent RNA methyltransferase [Jannaschia sp. S6380]MCK0166353.1 RsmB/NOP family class I SAM-dependent RNA methyltransferase [Jannaschia sp. S6380]